MWTQSSSPVQRPDMYKPLSDEVILAQQKSVYDRADQEAKKIGSTYNSLFGISTYGKDAEVLAQMQNEFKQQVGELSKQGLASPEANSRINQLITQYSSSPDVLNIHKRKAKFDEWGQQLKDFEEKGKFVPAWKMKQYNDAQGYYSGDKYYTDKQFTGNLTPGFDWDKHNKELIATTPEIEQLKKSGVNNDLYKGKTYDALHGKFYEGLNQPGALDDLRQHFEYDYGDEDYATHDQQNAAEQVNKLNNIIQTSNDPILVNQAKADLEYWSDFSGSVNPETSKEDAFQRYIKSNADDFARTNTNYALKESKMSDANKMYQEHSLRQQEDLYKLQLKTGILPEKGESQSVYIGRLAKAAQDQDLQIAQAKSDIIEQRQKDVAENANKLKIDYVTSTGIKSVSMKGAGEMQVGEQTIKKTTLLNSLGNTTTIKDLLESNPSKFGLNCATCSGSIDPNTLKETPDGKGYTYQNDSYGDDDVRYITKDALKAYILDNTVEVDLNNGAILSSESGEEQPQETKKQESETTQTDYKWSGEVPKGNVKVKSKTGEIGYIPESQLQDAIKEGYTKAE